MCWGPEVELGLSAVGAVYVGTFRFGSGVEGKDKLGSKVVESGHAEASPR